MKNTKKRVQTVSYILIILACFSALAACFSPWKGDEGILSVSIGGGARSVSENSHLFTHTVTVNGPGPEQTKTVTNTTTTVSFSVAPGMWNIDIQAHVGTVLIAVGETRSVNVKPGQNNAVTIPMKESDIPFDSMFFVTNGNDGGDGSLQWALGEVLEKEMEYTIIITVKEIKLKEQLSCEYENTLTILGNGVTLSPATDNGTRLMQINETSIVKISRVHFTGGYAGNENGGAINNNGNLTLESCIFSGNKAEGVTGASANGGAIYNSGTMTVNGCTFYNNHTSSNGGAIYNTDTLNLTGNLFFGNTNGDFMPSAVYNDGIVVSNGYNAVDEGFEDRPDYWDAEKDTSVTGMPISPYDNFGLIPGGEAIGIISNLSLLGDYPEVDFNGKKITAPASAGAVQRMAVPKKINNSEHLKNIGIENENDYPPDGYYQLTANLTLSDAGQSWIPIGDNSSPFKGVLDGNGFTIDLGDGIVDVNDNSDGYFVGLFGVIGEGGVVKNLRLRGIINLSFPGLSINAGAVAGVNRGTIQNVAAGVNLTIESSDSSAGGIAGINEGTIVDCYSTGDITTDDTGYAGGIAGQNSGSIIYCWTEGNIRGQSGAGGIVGQCSDGNIENCVALNMQITVDDVTPTAVTAGRIYGTGTGQSEVINNNYANSGMLVNNELVEDNANTDRNKHGKDFTNTNQGSWTDKENGPGWIFANTGQGTEASPWVWGGTVPKLWFEQ